MTRGERGRKASAAYPSRSTTAAFAATRGRVVAGRDLDDAFATLFRLASRLVHQPSPLAGEVAAPDLALEAVVALRCWWGW